MINCFVPGVLEQPSGISIRYESADGELTNVTVAYCSRGIELLRGAASLVSVHVWHCTEMGVYGNQANTARLVACYIELNAGWGCFFMATSNLIINSGTRIWQNGQTCPTLAVFASMASAGNNRG